MVKECQIDMVIGAGGANVMDCAKLGDFGTAYGIAVDEAILVPRYSLSLDREMTAYTGLVTLVQLSASILGDKNPVSYDAGISVIRNVLKATKKLKEEPENLDARGVILLGASPNMEQGFESVLCA